MVTLDAEIDSCREVSFGRGDREVTAEVFKPAAIDVPRNVAMIGWVQAFPGGKQYTFDVQRGNYVARTVISSVGGISESEVRALMESIAVRVSNTKITDEHGRIIQNETGRHPEG